MNKSTSEHEKKLFVVNKNGYVLSFGQNLDLDVEKLKKQKCVVLLNEKEAMTLANEIAGTKDEWFVPEIIEFKNNVWISYNEQFYSEEDCLKNSGNRSIYKYISEFSY